MRERWRSSGGSSDDVEPENGKRGSLEGSPKARRPVSIWMPPLVSPWTGPDWMRDAWRTGGSFAAFSGLPALSARGGPADGFFNLFSACSARTARPGPSEGPEIYPRVDASPGELLDGMRVARGRRGRRGRGADVAIVSWPFSFGRFSAFFGLSACPAPRPRRPRCWFVGDVVNLFGPDRSA